MLTTIKFHVDFHLKNLLKVCLCSEPNFGTLLPNAVAIKSIEHYLHKSCSDLAPEMLVKLTPNNGESMKSSVERETESE
jgi:hypothetical protein